jgi:hypothetical protein
MTGDSRFWILFGGIWLVFALAGVAAILFGGFILRRTLIASARERRLMQSGIPISATVTDVRRSLVEINRQTRWYVCYRYDYDGRTLTGESGNMPGDMVMDFKPGGRVRIKVDPQKPEESLFVGKA